MNQPIISIKLQNELDVVLAYKRAMQLSEFTGLQVAAQTKFATAVSEICRNVLEHVGEGTIRFTIEEIRGGLFLEAYIKDRGRGIPNVQEILNQRYAPVHGKGQGLFSSRKLVDNFQLESDFEKGTRVRLQIRIPANHPPINKSIIEGWADYFNHESSISPYAEIKRQNMQLIELLEQLRVRNIETEYQIQQIQHLNQELQESNHAVNELLKERDKSNQQLQRTNRILDEFAHTVTHDLKAPLHNVLSLTNIMADSLEEQDTQDAKQVLSMLQMQVHRMNHLITDVLAYSLTGRKQVPRRRVDVGELIHSIVSDSLIPTGFRVHVGDGFPTLETEEIYLRQIFSNLISNAVKYHDVSTGSIWVNVQPHPDFWEFVVEDDGPGIPAEYQDKVFDLFETTSDVNRPDSTGIGLALVRKILQEKGSRIWIESEGRGTAMHFTWPLEITSVVS